MKEELINEVQRRMLPYLNNEQLLRLKDALDAALCGLTISNDEAVPSKKNVTHWKPLSRPNALRDVPRRL